MSRTDTASGAESIVHDPRNPQPYILEGVRRCVEVSNHLRTLSPPAADEEVRAAALQFVRKLSGTTRPSRVNQVAFDRAVDDVTEAATRLMHSLTTNAPPRNREVESLKARERVRRFA